MSAKNSASHDKLAFRLTQILIKLNQGDKLDPQALADALWSVLRDADGAARMGRAGMAVTRDQDWDRVAARILAMAPGARG